MRADEKNLVPNRAIISGEGRCGNTREMGCNVHSYGEGCSEVVSVESVRRDGAAV